MMGYNVVKGPDDQHNEEERKQLIDDMIADESGEFESEEDEIERIANGN